MVSRTLRLVYRFRRIAALKDRIELLVKKYPRVSEEAIRKYASMDPTNGKYLEWLVRQEANGVVRPGQLGDYGDEIRDIVNFHIKVARNSYFQELTGLPKDIGKTPIYDVSHQMILMKKDLEELEFREEGKEKGFKVIYNTSPYKIIQVGGEGIDVDQAINALCYYGLNKWCTRYEHKAREYLEMGPMWVVFKGGRTLLQTDGFHVLNVQNKPFSFSHDMSLLENLVRLGIINKESIGELL